MSTIRKRMLQSQVYYPTIYPFGIHIYLRPKQKVATNINPLETRPGVLMTNSINAFIHDLHFAKKNSWHFSSNYYKIPNKYFFDTPCIVVCLACLNLQPHYSVTVAIGLIECLQFCFDKQYSFDLHIGGQTSVL